MWEETITEANLTLESNSKVSLLEVPITLEPVAPERVVAGGPREGFIDITANFAGSQNAGPRHTRESQLAVPLPELGIWEMSEGTDIDVEADELFVVLAGRATLTLEKPGKRVVVEIQPGDLVQLQAGTRSTWEVQETLRKLYLCPPE